MLKSDDLNYNEKKEIKDDVKDALGKARKNSIDNSNESGTKNVLNQKEIDNFINKINNRVSKKTIIITIILTLFIATFVFYIYIINNPKTIFNMATDKIFNIISDFTPDYNGITKGNITISSDLNQKINIKMDYSSDKNHNILNADLETTYNDQQFLDAKIYSEDNSLYIYSDDLLDKYIEFDKSNIMDAKFNVIIGSINKAVIKGISAEKFIGAKKQININSKSILNVYKSSLEINDNNKDRIIDTFGEALKADSKFISEIRNITGTSQAEVEKFISKYTENLKTSFNNKRMIISVYTKGLKQEFVKYEIENITNNEDISYSITKAKENEYTYLMENKTTNQKQEGQISITKNTDNNIIILNVDNKIFKIQTTNKKIDKVEKIDVTNSVEYNKLSESDKLEIIFKLFTNSYFMN